MLCGQGSLENGYKKTTEEGQNGDISTSCEGGFQDFLEYFKHFGLNS